MASFAELREVVGEAMAVRLSVVFGGTRIYVPARPVPGGWLAEAIGIEAVNALCRAFNGEQIEIPLGPGKRARQREKVVALRSRGMGTRAIALALDITERQVRNILGSSPKVLGALFVPLLLFPSFLPAGVGGAVINRVGASGACVSVSTSSASEILNGASSRHDCCVKCSVPVNIEFAAPSASDTAPASEPTSSAGYPLAAASEFCRSISSSPNGAVRSRMDAISTSGSGSCCTLEEQ